jgi:hypothetical protein
MRSTRLGSEVSRAFGQQRARSRGYVRDFQTPVIAVEHLSQGKAERLGEEGK